MKPHHLILMAALVVTPALAAEKPKPVTPSSILESAPPTVWRDVAPEDLVVMTLADGHKVVWQLAPAFSPVHVANVKAFARAKWWDGSALIRVQDGYVTQWGWPDEPEPKYPDTVKAEPPAEYEQPVTGKLRPLPYRDAYATQVGHIDGWPVASDGKAQWIPHCYGMIGVARGLNPDTGSSSQLYTVIGHAPRHLDRNLAIAGRVVSGMEYLTARPRGTETLGFYKTAEERTKIVSIRVASDLPKGEQPAFQVLDTRSPTFDAWVKARANRKDDFFAVSAGALDICNALPPVREKK
ncbi:peptidylprolyl isomerase [Asticcacaulis sp. BYS171W]|uniref:Peptidylprolyl isomerase n=1 Tax=Asticcacaulis aquaticus TaxID=2984212 RepID=A0ABT5HTN9_9CAUL|nr:peptidylprolyl isomerase [Asticcacaulis aquaticus]MDC7683303.1 peptidylprolyl isomerase [Asticcacaulis aquaticus]